MFFFLKVKKKIKHKKKTKHKKKIIHEIKQKKAQSVLNKLAKISSCEKKIIYLRKIDPLVFEELILEAFAIRGYKVCRNLNYTHDGGIDGMIIIKKKNILYNVNVIHHISVNNMY